MHVLSIEEVLSYTLPYHCINGFSMSVTYNLQGILELQLQWSRVHYASLRWQNTPGLGPGVCCLGDSMRF